MLEIVPDHITAPDGIELRQSDVDKTLVGAWCLKSMSTGSILGPFVGEVVYEHNEKLVDYRFAWEVYDLDTSELLYIVNATDPNKGNWMRYVNCARYLEEQNLVSVQDGKDIFYKAIKDIKVGEELLTWYEPFKKRKKPRKQKNSVNESKDSAFSDTSSIADTSSVTGKPKRNRKKKKMFDDEVFISDFLKKKRRKSVKNEEKDSVIEEEKDKSLPKKPGKKKMSSKDPETNDNNDGDSSKLKEDKVKNKGGNIKPKVEKLKQKRKNSKSEEDDVPGKNCKNKEEIKSKAKNEKVKKADKKSGMKSESKNSYKKLPDEQLGKQSEDLADSVELNWTYPTKDHEYQFDLQSHFNITSNGRRMYKCDICSGIYRHTFSLKRHYLRNHINCRYLSQMDIGNCMISVSQQHSSIVNSNDEDTLAKINQFLTKETEGESSEVKVENRPSKSIVKPGLYRCHDCYKLFDFVEDLITHTHDHPPVQHEKQFACDKCHMRFPYKQNLVRHKLVHEGETKTQKKDAKAEKKEKVEIPQTATENSTGKPFACPDCPMRFRYIVNLRKHEPIHSAERPFECSSCGKAFPTATNLKKHIHIAHVGSKVPCKFCSSVFNHVGRLRKHIRVEHPDIHRQRLLKLLDKRGKLSPKAAQTLELAYNSEKEKVQSNTKGKEKVKAKDKNVEKKEEKEESEFQYACVVCKKRFGSYISMCRHRRMAHRKEKKLANEEKSEPVVEEIKKKEYLIPKKAEAPLPELSDEPIDNSPEAIAEFYANVANNIADNLNFYIDGGESSLTKFRDHIRIEDYESVFEVKPVENNEEFKWDRFNFPSYYDSTILENNFVSFEDHKFPRTKQNENESSSGVISFNDRPPGLCTRRRSSRDGSITSENMSNSQDGFSSNSRDVFSTLENNESNSQDSVCDKKCDVGDKKLVIETTEKLDMFVNNDNVTVDLKNKVPHQMTELDGNERNFPIEITAEVNESSNSESACGGNVENVMTDDDTTPIDVKIEVPLCEVDFKEEKDNVQTDSKCNSMNCENNPQKTAGDEKSDEMENSKSESSDNQICDAKREVISTAIDEKDPQKTAGDEKSDEMENSKSESSDNQICDAKREVISTATDEKDPQKTAGDDKSDEMENSKSESSDNHICDAKREVISTATDKKDPQKTSGDDKSDEMENSKSESSDNHICDAKREVISTATDEKDEIVCETTNGQSCITKVVDDKQADVETVTEIRENAHGCNCEGNCESNNASTSSFSNKSGGNELDGSASQKPELNDEISDGAQVLHSDSTFRETKNCHRKDVSKSSEEQLDSLDGSVSVNLVEKDLDLEIDSDSKCVPEANCNIDSVSSVEGLDNKIEVKNDESAEDEIQKVNLDTKEKLKLKVLQKMVNCEDGNFGCVDAAASTSKVYSNNCDYTRNDSVQVLNNNETNQIKNEDCKMKAINNTNTVKTDSGQRSLEDKEEKKDKENIQFSGEGVICKDKNLLSGSTVVINDVVIPSYQSIEVRNILDQNSSVKEDRESDIDSDSGSSGILLMNLSSDSGLDSDQDTEPSSVLKGLELAKSPGKNFIENSNLDILSAACAIKSEEMRRNANLPLVRSDFYEVPGQSPHHNYDNIAFGKHGQVSCVCSVCIKHFRDQDLLLRHQIKKHPSIYCHSLEVEEGHEIEYLYYAEPCNVGVLGMSGKALEPVVDRSNYTCTRCYSSFKNVDRLRVHIINCAPKPTLPEPEEKPKRKYRKRVKKIDDTEMNEGQRLNGKEDVTVVSKETTNDNNSQSKMSKVKVKRRRFMGCRKRKVVSIPDTPECSPVKITCANKKRGKSIDLRYNPGNHVRRRELTEVLDKHQCNGCGVKFKTISLLERHIKKCDRKDKFKDLKVMKSQVNETFHKKLKHTCLYCLKGFTYPKTLMNHYKAFCLVKKEKVSKGCHSDVEKQEEMQMMVRLKQQDEDRSLRKSVELETPNIKKGGWPKGVKRKLKRKGHCWTTIKKRKVSTEEEAGKVNGQEVLPSNSDLQNGESEVKDEGLDSIRSVSKSNENAVLVTVNQTLGLSKSPKKKKVTKTSPGPKVGFGNKLLKKMISVKSPKKIKTCKKVSDVDAGIEGKNHGNTKNMSPKSPKKQNSDAGLEGKNHGNTKNTTPKSPKKQNSDKVQNSSSISKKCPDSQVKCPKGKNFMKSEVKSVHFANGKISVTVLNTKATSLSSKSKSKTPPNKNVHDLVESYLNIMQKSKNESQEGQGHKGNDNKSPNGKKCNSKNATLPGDKMDCSVKGQGQMTKSPKFPKGIIANVSSESFQEHGSRTDISIARRNLQSVLSNVESTTSPSKGEKGKNFNSAGRNSLKVEVSDICITSCKIEKHSPKLSKSPCQSPKKSPVKIAAKKFDGGTLKINEKSAVGTGTKNKGEVKLVPSASGHQNYNKNKTLPGNQMSCVVDTGTKKAEIKNNRKELGYIIEKSGSEKCLDLKQEIGKSSGKLSNECVMLQKAGIQGDTSCSAISDGTGASLKMNRISNPSPKKVKHSNKNGNLVVTGHDDNSLGKTGAEKSTKSLCDNEQTSFKNGKPAKSINKMKAVKTNEDDRTVEIPFIAPRALTSSGMNKVGGKKSPKKLKLNTQNIVKVVPVSPQSDVSR